MPSIHPDNTAQRLLQSPDLSSIFLTGFNWLEGLDYPVIDGWIRVEGSAPVRRSKEFLRVYHHLDRLLAGAAKSPRPGLTVLNAKTQEHLRRRVDVLFANARSEKDAALVVLALLLAIDDRFGTNIRKEYYRSTEGTASCVRLAPDRAMPKPWPAFGTGGARFGGLAPATGVGAPRLFLEHQFGRLVAPLVASNPALSPRPALHRSGEVSLAASSEEWTVATVDLLADLSELHVGQDEDHFWVPAYRDLDVERAIAARLEWALDRCRKASALLIVVPELALSKPLVNLAASRLADWPGSQSDGLLPMIIAGRLHEPVAGQHNRFRNGPAVITPDGVLVWDYWKVRRFQARALMDRWEACAEPPDYLLAIDTPLGRVACTICLDFSDAHLQDVLRELRATVLVVPSMTPGRTVGPDFYNHAVGHTSASRAATIFSNSSLHIRTEILNESKDARTLSFVRGSTRIAHGSPHSLYELPSPNVLATVSLYGMSAKVPGGLSVGSPTSFHLPEPDVRQPAPAPRRPPR